jgi:thioredoxin-like negative regulator of GroEL
MAETVQEALSKSMQGDHLAALRLFQEAAKRFDAASAGEKDAIRKGLFNEATVMIERHDLEAAIGGLVALLPLTRCRGSCQASVIQVRMLLENAAMTMILTDRSELAIPALEALLQDSPGTPMRWALLARAYVGTGDLEAAGRCGGASPCMPTPPSCSSSRRLWPESWRGGRWGGPATSGRSF